MAHIHTNGVVVDQAEELDLTNAHLASLEEVPLPDSLRVRAHRLALLCLTCKGTDAQQNPNWERRLWT
jgi:hypothetical protein